MGAANPTRRKLTARETAERFGCSTRTVRRIVAEPRETFLARAAERREQVLALRSEGLKLAEIADQLGMPAGTVRRIASEAKKAS